MVDYSKLLFLPSKLAKLGQGTFAGWSLSTSMQPSNANCNWQPQKLVAFHSDVKDPRLGSRRGIIAFTFPPLVIYHYLEARIAMQTERTSQRADGRLINEKGRWSRGVGRG